MNNTISRDDRCEELVKEGKSFEQILLILRSEGFRNSKRLEKRFQAIKDQHTDEGSSIADYEWDYIQIACNEVRESMDITALNKLISFIQVATHAEISTILQFLVDQD